MAKRRRTYVRQRAGAMRSWSAVRTRGLIPEVGDDIRSGLSLRGGGTDMTRLGRRHLHVGKLGGEQNGSF